MYMASRRSNASEYRALYWSPYFHAAAGMVTSPKELDRAIRLGSLQQCIQLTDSHRRSRWSPHLSRQAGYARSPLFPKHHSEVVDLDRENHCTSNSM